MQQESHIGTTAQIVLVADCMRPRQRNQSVVTD
jgi:hypothetical protein